MPKFEDGLRGYGYDIHRRDGFRCVYCGLDGSQWPNWLFLSVDHLLPHGHPDRETPAFKVTACRFCNESENRRPYAVDGKTPAEIVEMKKAAISRVRDEYHQFWGEHVAAEERGGD